MKRIIFFLMMVIVLLIIFSPAIYAVINNYTYQIINTFPHDKNAFTQGLYYENGYLFEGTGLKGESSLRQVELKTGKIIYLYNLPDNLFGEGITSFKDKIYQLTWQAKTGFVYNQNFELINKFSYPHQGWGLTHDSENLIMSDGTDSLFFLDPETLTEHKMIKVTLNNLPVTNINEMEYIQGEIYANIWLTNQIVKINPNSGQVTGIIDLTGIINPDIYDYTLNVLNGIAYDEIKDRLFITGKRWPLIFEIKVIPVG